MITAKTRKSTICFSKILTIFSLALLLSFTTGAVAYASEVTEAPATVSTNGTTTSEGTTIEVTTADGTVTEESSDILTADGVTLGEGYYIDEQGQVYYDDTLVTIEEPVIVDLPEEDAEEAAEEDAASQDTIEEKEATDTDAAKAEDAKTQTAKEPEVKKPSYSEADLRLLSCLIYAEAGNQSYKGMLAVANVVLNRVKSDVFWHVNSIKEVVYDRKWSVQFSVTIKSKKTGLSPLDKALKCYDTGKFTGANPEAEKKAMQRATKAAKAALEGKNNIGEYLCFTYKGGSGSIKRKYPDYQIIGDHIFYRTK